MTAEKPNYLDRPELKDTVLQEQEILKMKDPAQVDLDSMRKDAVAKLDKVAGKDKNSKAYKEALAKLDENMLKLEEVKEFAMSKIKVKEVLDKNKSGVKVGTEMEAVFRAADYDFLKGFLDKKYSNALLTVNRDMVLRADGGKLQKSIDGTMAKLSKSLDGYYEDFLAKTGEEIVKKVKSTKEGYLSLADFDALEDAASDTKFYADNGMDGTSRGKFYQELAKQKYKVLAEVRKEAVKKLSAYDRKIVLNYETALKAFHRNPQSAEKWTAAASEKYFMNLEKSQAIAVKEKTAVYGIENTVLSKGNEAFNKALAMEASSPKAAQKFYEDARKAYQLQLQIEIDFGGVPNPTLLVKGKEAPKKRAEV